MGLAHIAPLIAQNNTAETNSLTGLGNYLELLRIADDLMTVGRDYLVLYCVGFGGASTSVDVEIEVLMGTTVIASPIQRGQNPANVDYNDHYCAGIYVVTGVANEDLIMRVNGTGRQDVNAKSMIAIPLNEFTSGTHYHQSLQNGDTAELTVTGIAWTTALSSAITLTAPGDYLVLASMECNMQNDFDAAWARFRINGQVQKTEWFRTTRTTSNWSQFTYARVHNFAGTAATFELQGRANLAANTCAFRRGRIFLIRRDSFVRLSHASQDTQQSVTTQFDSAFTDIVSVSHTPYGNEDTLLIGNTFASNATDDVSKFIRLRNTTDSATYADYIAADQMINAGEDTLDTPTAFAVERINATKTYALQGATETTANPALFQYADIICIGLTRRYEKVIR